MFRIVMIRTVVLVLAFQAISLTAQSNSTGTVVPRLVNYPGRVVDGQGKPVAGPATVTFAIYKDEEGGERLWTETQNIRADEQGNYVAELGATERGGIPLALFNSGESRWLGVAVNGRDERPRAMLLSVPYALKAADAETLGGLPASAFMRANGSGTSSAALDSAGVPSPRVTTNPAITGKGTAGYLPVWDSASDLANSSILQSKGNVGIGITAPSALFDVNGKVNLRDTVTLVPKGTDPTLEIRGTTYKVDQTGKITFVAGQTFPGAGTIKGVSTASTSGIQGGGATGTLNLSIRPEGITDSMLQNSVVTVPVTAPLSGGGSVALGASATPLALTACPAGEALVSNGTAWSCAAAGTGKVTKVALNAPASDFTVSGSPVTTSGTLGLKWNVTPTDGDVASAIVKRDATGSFAAGAITANLGISSFSPTIGVYGESSGSASGANGVEGDTYGAGGSGVAGINYAGGIGVYGQGGTGVFGTGTVGFATDSNVQQAPGAGGWVKAMVYVQGSNAPYTITRCFNSTLTGAAASTVPCGINLTEVKIGQFNLDFNFQVYDRFYTGNTSYGGGTSVALYSYSGYPDRIITNTYVGSDTAASDYLVVVF
jgi:hypothetical protein